MCSSDLCMDETVLTRAELRESLPEGVTPRKAAPDTIMKELARLADLASSGKFNIEEFAKR